MSAESSFVVPPTRFASARSHLVEEFMTRTAGMVDGAWRYERVEGAGHWIQLDQPEVLSALLVDHLSVSSVGGAFTYRSECQPD